MRVNAGRWTSHVDGDFVVLLLGVRGGLVASRRAASDLRRMRRALAELARDPHQGLLGFQRHGGTRGVLVQYWRSVESLQRLTGPDGAYTGVWSPWFGAADGTGGSSGYWYETFRVRAGDYDAAYHDVPAIGLLRAGVPAPVRSR